MKATRYGNLKSYGKKQLYTQAFNLSIIMWQEPVLFFVEKWKAA